MATKDWKELEGTSWRLDVGSTEKEALASTEPSKLFITKDNSIVMNGEVVGNAVSLSQDGVSAANALGEAVNRKTIFSTKNIVDTHKSELGGIVSKTVYDSSILTQYTKGQPFEVFCTQGIRQSISTDKYMIWFGLRNSQTNILRYSYEQIIGKTEDEFYAYKNPIAFKLSDGTIYTPYKGSGGLLIDGQSNYLLADNCIIPTYNDLKTTATTYNDGLMTAEDKSKIDNAFVGVAANMVSYGDDYGLAYSFTRANGTGVKSTILPVVGKISGEPGLMKASDKNKFDELVNTTIPNLKQSAESVTALASQITALEAKVAALEKYGHLGSISWSKLTKLTTESTSEEIIANLQIKDCTGNLITDGDTIYSIFNACASYGKFLTDRQRYCKVQVELLSNTWVLTEIANGWYQEADGSWKHHRPTLKTISFDFNTNKQMSVHDVSASYPLYGQASE